MAKKWLKQIKGLIQSFYRSIIKLIALMGTKILTILLLLITLLTSPSYVFASHVITNEIYYDVDSLHGLETDNEWVELYNTTGDDINLESWTISDNSSNPSYIKILPAITIKKNGTLVITAQSSTWSFWNINSDKISLDKSIGGGLNNDGDRLILKDNLGQDHDKLSYGTDTTYSSVLPDIDEGHSLERVPVGGNFVDQSMPTPGSVSQTITSSPTPTPSSSISASSLKFSEVPSQINSDQSFKVNVTLSMPNNANTEYYLKGEFKKSDGTRYLGLTKKDSDWVEYGDDLSDQYKITTDASGNWSGNLEVKPDVYDKDYKGSGQYLFKIGRYTAAGSGLWSNPVTLDIVDTTSSPTPAPSSNPTSTPSTTKVTTTTSSPKPTPSIKSSYQIASVAGIKTSASASASSLPGVEIKNQKQTNPITWVGVIFILIGTGSIGYIYLRKNGRIPF